MPEAKSTLTTTRRTLAFGGSAAAAIGITAGAAASVADLVPTPDAELIAVCQQHVVNINAFNADPNDMDEDCPLHRAYVGTLRAIGGMKPQTHAGMVAKAQAARAEARLPNVEMNPDGTMATDWAWDLVNDLLRIEGRS